MTTEILSLTEIASSDFQKEVLHNRALRQLEAQLVHVKDKDLTAPPGSPAEGDTYIVAASPTGGWTGHAKAIAHFAGGAWVFYTPREGHRLWVDDEDVIYAYNGSAWIVSSGTAALSEPINPQTGTSYTVVAGDLAHLVTLSNGAAIAVTLPQAGASFPNGWFADFKATGAGTVTITPTTSTIDGTTSITLTTGEGARIVSDGTNYFSFRGKTGTTGATGATGATGSAGATGATGASGNATEVVNAQTGTSYTVLNGDSPKLVTFTNAAAIAVTLPQAGSGGNFASGWWCDVQNRGAGAVTITPTTSTIDGAAFIVLFTGEGIRICSDGTNYFTVRGKQHLPRVSAVTYAASVTLDCSTADVFTITLTGNITIAFSNGTNGQKIEVITTQDGTGSRLITWDSGVTWGSDIALVAASTGINKVDRWGLEYNSALAKYNMIAYARGY